MAKYHDRAARLIAKKLGGGYDPTASPDVKGPGFQVEVKSTASEIPKALVQLRGCQRRCYLSLPKSEHKKALPLLKSSGVGLVDRQGNIAKRARKKV